MKDNQEMPPEIWVPFPSHPLYEISNMGQVRNAETKHVIATKLNPTGYAYTRVQIKGRKQKVIPIHQMVCQAFIGPCPKGMVINHINSVKSDNRLENLEYVHQRENVTHASKRKHLTGAYYNKFHKRWQSMLHHNNKKIHLGAFHTEIEAHEAYMRKLKELGQENKYANVPVTRTEQVDLPNLSDSAVMDLVTETCLHPIVGEVYRFDEPAILEFANLVRALTAKPDAGDLSELREELHAMANRYHGVPIDSEACDYYAGVVQEYERTAADLLSTLPAQQQAGDRKFKVGDRVEKIKGSCWCGHIVGFYSTNLTPIGYAVESELETGSVQIYPESALRLLAAAPQKPPIQSEGECS